MADAKKLIAVLSSSFCNDPKNNFYLQIAIRCAMKPSAMLLPVIYGNQKIHNIHPCIDMVTKLKYDPMKRYTNFWTSLMKAFNITDLSEQDVKMDFVHDDSISCESLATISTILDSTECLTKMSKRTRISIKGSNLLKIPFRRFHSFDK